MLICRLARKLIVKGRERNIEQKSSGESIRIENRREENRSRRGRARGREEGVPKTTQNRTQDEPKFPTCPFLDPGGKREEKKRARGRGRGEKRREKKGEDKRTSRRECDFWSIFGSPCFPRTSWEPFEELLGLLGCLFGASWGSIGPSREALGRLLGALGGLLEASWGL